MHSFSIKRAFSLGWNKFMERPWFLVGLVLAIMVLTFLTVSQSTAYTALSLILYAGYLAVLLKHFDGQPIRFDDLFTLDNRWISFAFLSIIKGILIIIGLVLLVAPGIYLALRWVFAEYLVIEKGMGPVEALRRSGELTKGNIWRLLGFFLVAILLLALGLIAFVVGFFVAAVVISLSLIAIYRELSHEARGEVLASGTAQ